MSQHSHDALVLLTRDIGEADRLCILFTREAGKKAARASGVRRPTSRIGGLLLPWRRVRIELQERGTSAVITGAVDTDPQVRDHAMTASFAVLAQTAELLLRLTEDDEPLPTVFDLLLELRGACIDGLPNPFLFFQLRLLHLLGFLPVTTEDMRFAHLAPLAQSVVWSCARGRPLADLCAMPADRTLLQRFVDQLLMDHLNRPLQSTGIAADMLCGGERFVFPPHSGDMSVTSPVPVAGRSSGRTPIKL